jgi:hypothetical protein
MAAALGLVVVLWTTLGADGGEDFPVPTTVAPVAPVAPVLPDAGTTAPATGTGTILSVVAFDPDGDGVENDDQAAAAIDGDPSTKWNTVCYSSEYLGGKGGVGLAITLDAPSTGTLTIDVDSAPFIIDVHTTADGTAPAEISGWGPAISSDDSLQPEVLSVPITSPATHGLVLVRQLGSSGFCSNDNPFRGTISEVDFAPGG